MNSHIAVTIIYQNIAQPYTSVSDLLIKLQCPALHVILGEK